MYLDCRMQTFIYIRKLTLSYNNYVPNDFNRNMLFSSMERYKNSLKISQVLVLEIDEILST